MTAGGTIRPNRFVKASTAADNTALEADANEAVIGVATNANNDAFTSDNHAIAGQSVTVRFGVAFVEAGGAITRGGRVKSDADGKAVAVATSGTTNQESAGTALESASGDGAIIKVFINPQVIRPAVA